MNLSTHVSPSYTRPVIVATVLSVGLIVLSSMVLDMGEALTASVFAMAGFWIGVIVIIRVCAVRNLPLKPTCKSSDLVRWLRW
jgi:hypothetical protein